MKKKATRREIDKMFEKSNKLNTQSLALWKQSNEQRVMSMESWKKSVALWDQVLKLRVEAGKLLTDLDLEEKSNENPKAHNQR